MSKISDIVKARSSESMRKRNPEFFGIGCVSKGSELTVKDIQNTVAWMEKSKGSFMFKHANSKKSTVAPHIAAKEESPLAIKFKMIWEQIGGVHLTPEYRFHKERKWRFDFAHPCYKVAIELEGFVYQTGRGHSSVSGILKNIEKYNEAVFLGWRVIRLHNLTITAENLRRIADLIG